MHLRRLKPASGIGGLWIPIITGVFFIIFFSFMSIKMGIGLLVFIFLLACQYSLYAFHKTKTLIYFFSGMFQLFYAGFLSFAPHIGVIGENKIFAFSCVIISVGFGLAAFSQVILGNHRWRGRDIFELSAKNISEASNGFTSRPHPYGKHDYTRREVISFVNYLQSKLVGLTIIDNKRIYLIPVKNGREYGMLYKSGYSLLECSWISFTEDGQIVIHISKADYLDYHEALSFNELCNSMGEVFMNFFDHYKKGEEIRILDQMNSVKVSFLN